MLEIFCKLSAAIHTRRDDENGASAVEYGLLVAGIAALIVAVVFLFGGMIEGVFTDTCSTLQADGGTGTGTCT
jgi:pilus assembly protein Flp/PilA